MYINHKRSGVRIWYDATNEATAEAADRFNFAADRQQSLARLNKFVWLRGGALAFPAASLLVYSYGKSILLAILAGVGAVLLYIAAMAYGERRVHARLREAERSLRVQGMLGLVVELDSPIFQTLQGQAIERNMQNLLVGGGSVAINSRIVAYVKESMRDAQIIEGGYDNPLVMSRMRHHAGLALDHITRDLSY